MRLLLVPALVLGLLAGGPAEAREADAAAIRGVIEDQIDAFRREDLARAYAHASPGIQGKFRDPATFATMVERGYPMIWRPERYEIGPLEDGPRGPVQTVVFVDGAGEVWEADYAMREVDGRWRIAGVTLRRLPGVSS
jgi:hypothetical protein